LVDIFRTEEPSCLLGTDAMRNGVDVPGRALTFCTASAAFSSQAATPPATTTASPACARRSAA
jgi:hypothetical protein